MKNGTMMKTALAAVAWLGVAGATYADEVPAILAKVEAGKAGLPARQVKHLTDEALSLIRGEGRPIKRRPVKITLPPSSNRPSVGNVTMSYVDETPRNETLYYGYWCGGGWSGGKFGTKGPIDDLDAKCQIHDRAYGSAKGNAKKILQADKDLLAAVGGLTNSQLKNPGALGFRNRVQVWLGCKITYGEGTIKYGACLTGGAIVRNFSLR